MGKYIKKFDTHAGYSTYINGQDAILPNVSYCEDNNEVHYNPWVGIIYRASNKLTETTMGSASGLHTNGFNTTIKSHTFENGIGKIEFDDVLTSVGTYAFRGCSGITAIEIPNTVTSIGGNAFYNCTNLTSIEIPNTVTSIGGNAFQNCSSLTSIEIPEGITTISNLAFSGCSGLTNITIPNTVTTIGSNAFNNCTNLTSVTIPSSVTSIGQTAFGYCSKLINITSLATTAPTIQNQTFINVKTGGTLYVPTGATGYDTWMGTGDYYLGKYNWTKVEQ